MFGAGTSGIPVYLPIIGHPSYCTGYTQKCIKYAMKMTAVVENIHYFLILKCGFRNENLSLKAQHYEVILFIFNSGFVTVFSKYKKKKK